MGSLVVFHGHGTTRFARWFGAPGFRHCFVCVAVGDYWISFDPRLGLPRLEVIAGTDFDLAGFYRDMGFTVIETEQATRFVPGSQPARWPLMLATCVGAVKRILGIAAPWVLTPTQLCNYLTRKDI